MMTRLAILFVALCACSDNTNGVNPLVDTQLNQGEARGADLANQLDVDLAGNDAVTILGKAAEIMAMINLGEVNEGGLAVSAATAVDVHDFATLMVSDHTALLARLDVVRRDLALPTIPNAVSVALQMEGTSTLAMLRATPPGAFDLTYMETQVSGHAEALVILDRLSISVPANAETDQFISQMRATVNDHLIRAEAILSTF